MVFPTQVHHALQGTINGLEESIDETIFPSKPFGLDLETKPMVESLEECMEILSYLIPPYLICFLQLHAYPRSFAWGNS